jgi:RNA polymerase sigma-70 factor (ECF subfamily)
MALPDAEIERRPSADLDATAEAFADHFDYLCRTLRRFGVGAAHVEDLAQDVFVVMCRRWADYQPERPLRAWLAGIAFNVAQRYFARAWRERPARHLDPEDEAPPPDEQLDSTRARQLALASLNALSPRDRAIVVLHEIEGMPVQEMAAMLSVPLFTVYTRLRRARMRFAKVAAELQAKSVVDRGALLSAAALLSLERQPLPSSAQSAERARKLMRGILPKLSSWRPVNDRSSPVSGAPLVIGTVIVTATLALVTSVALFAAGRRAPALARRESLAAPAQPPARTGPGDGLSGYWRFDEGRGSLASDLSGGRGDCILHALDPDAAWVGGAIGGAIDVRGGWLECPRSTPARASAAVSVAAWVRAGLRGQMAIVGRQLDAHRDVFLLSLMWGRPKVRGTLWGKRSAITAPGRIPAGRWVHLAFTHTAEGTTRLYQDGVEVGHSQSIVTSQPALDTPIAIGVDVNGPGRRERPLLGAVDEVVVYDRALAAQEVAALARGAQPPARP